MKLPSPEFSVHIDLPVPLAVPFGTCSLNFCGACRLGAAFLPLWDTVKDVSPGKAKHPRTRLVSRRGQPPPAAVGALDDPCLLSRREQRFRVRGGRGEGLAGLSAALPSAPGLVPPGTRGLV